MPRKIRSLLEGAVAWGGVKAGANGTGFKIMPGRASEFTLNTEEMRR